MKLNRLESGQRLSTVFLINIKLLYIKILCDPLEFL